MVLAGQAKPSPALGQAFGAWQGSAGISISQQLTAPFARTRSSRSKHDGVCKGAGWDRDTHRCCMIPPTAYCGAVL